MTDISPTKFDQHIPDFWDYFELFKPRVMRLVVFTAAVGLVLAPGSMNPVLAIVALLSIALGAGASGALNMYIDSDIDEIMVRTQSRPIPSGRVDRGHALYLGVFASAISVAMLGLYTNWLAGALLAFTIFFYVVIYSLWLKRSTPQNIVIGGAAGAFPPMVGWAAATGTISIESIMLFMVIFLWTPPHFWALALFRNDDYTAANVPMMPVVRGEASTRKQIFLYSIALAIVTIATSLLSIGGPLSFGFGTIGSIMMVVGGYNLWRAPAADNFRNEKRYFGFSIVFLFVFFLCLLGDSFINHWAILG